jgi:hypothetical protein
VDFNLTHVRRLPTKHRANHLVAQLLKKALAIAVLAIELRPGPFGSASDQAHMKTLLDHLIASDVELEFYARAARIAVTGGPE